MPLQSGELNRCIFEASDALGDLPGSVQSENKVRGTMKVQFQPPRNRCILFTCNHKSDTYYALVSL